MFFHHECMSIICEDHLQGCTRARTQRFPLSWNMGHMSHGTSQHMKGKNARNTKAVNRPPTVEAVGWRRLDGNASVKDKDLVQNSSGDPHKADRWWSLRKNFNLWWTVFPYHLLQRKDLPHAAMTMFCLNRFYMQLKGEVGTAVFITQHWRERGTCNGKNTKARCFRKILTEASARLDFQLLEPGTPPKDVYEIRDQSSQSFKGCLACPLLDYENKNH